MDTFPHNLEAVVHPVMQEDYTIDRDMDESEVSGNMGQVFPPPVINFSEIFHSQLPVCDQLCTQVSQF